MVTGMGIISPLGDCVSKYINSLKNGTKAFAETKRYLPSDCYVLITSELNGFKATDYMPRRLARHLNLCGQYAMAAALEAIEKCELRTSLNSEFRSGVVVGSAMGGLERAFEIDEMYKNKGISALGPFITQTMADNIALYISVEAGFKGPTFAISSGCTSSASALFLAYNLIKTGQLERVIVVGTETPINETIISLFRVSHMIHDGMKRSVNEIVRPFDKSADGFIISEGAGCMILEESHAIGEKREKYIRAEIKGAAETCDATSVSNFTMEVEPIIMAIELAIREASLQKQDIDVVVAYANSSIYDKREALALDNYFFQDHLNPIVSTIKQYTGHSIGANTIMETVASIELMNENLILPVVDNFDPIAEAKNLNFLYAKSHCIYRNILKNTYGIGNRNNSIIIGGI